MAEPHSSVAGMFIPLNEGTDSQIAESRDIESS